MPCWRLLKSVLRPVFRGVSKGRRFRVVPSYSSYRLNICSVAYCPPNLHVLKLRQQLTQPDCFDKNEEATGNKSRRKAVFVLLG